MDTPLLDRSMKHQIRHMPSASFATRGVSPVDGGPAAH